MHTNSHVSLKKRHANVFFFNLLFLLLKINFRLIFDFINTVEPYIIKNSKNKCKLHACNTHKESN